MSTVPRFCLRLLLLLAYLATPTAYALSRLASSSRDVRAGYACIPTPKERLVAPGQHATMHIYDSSSLEALRHAQSRFNGTYGQVVIDEAAMRERRFALEPVGARVKVLSVTPSTHTDKFGGTSQSVLAEVIGVGIIEPRVLEKMPYMTIEEPGDDGLLQPLEEPLDGAAKRTADLAEAAALCETLEEVACFKGPLTRQTERELCNKGGGGGRSLGECVERVLELRSGGAAAAGGDGGMDGGDEVCASSRLVLSALAATAHLPGATRYEAMCAASRGQAAQLVELVAGALDEEGRRRLALKALSSLSK